MYTQVFGWDPRLIPKAGTGHLDYLPIEQCIQTLTHATSGCKGEGCTERGAEARSRGTQETNPIARRHRRRLPRPFCRSASRRPTPSAAVRGADSFSPGAGMLRAPRSNLFFRGGERGEPDGLQPARSARLLALARKGRKERFSSCLRRGEFYLLHLQAGGAGRPRSAGAEV